MSLVIIVVGAFWYLRWRKRRGGNPVSEYDLKGQPMSPFLSPAKTSFPYYVSPPYFFAPSVEDVDLYDTLFR